MLFYGVARPSADHCARWLGGHVFSFFDRLMVSLSRRSGDRRWGLLSAFCAALILGWVVMALP